MGKEKERLGGCEGEKERPHIGTGHMVAHQTGGGGFGSRGVVGVIEEISA